MGLLRSLAPDEAMAVEGGHVLYMVDRLLADWGTQDDNADWGGV